MSRHVIYLYCYRLLNNQKINKMKIVKVTEKATGQTKLELQKGESIQYLDYTIMNSFNNDGLVLYKECKKFDYETHLGNFGNVMTAKKYALYHFMISRPEIFHDVLVQRLNKAGSGIMYEYFIMKNELKRLDIPMPEEITDSGDLNHSILFNGKKI